MPIPAPFPTYTKIWHNEAYPAIDPHRPELSAKGKTIVITGAGTGIGAGTVRAYAKAGAAKISLIARRLNVLTELKDSLKEQFPNTTITVHSANVTDLAALKKAASEIGAWDVLVLNAGYMSDPGSVVGSNIDDWWYGFEVNVKGPVLCLQAFDASKNVKAKVIGMSSAVITMPTQFLVAAGGSSYVSSKIALTKVLEMYGAENPDVFVTQLHPGVVYEGSDMAQKSELSDLPRDDVKLPAQFIVWLASEEASFLRGKFSYCNWDVDELKSHAKELTESLTLSSGLLGFPWLGPQTA